MKRLTMTTAAALLTLASPLAAQDADGDGNVTLEEFQAAYPDATSDVFVAIDADEDGVLSAAELQAAKDNGLLPS